ncbi:MAG: hypothetical protein C0485_16145 [Pirellula sp.]|nr:hypothetical protein [Pirellula sp.]
MVAKGFLAAAAIIICCSTTLRGNDTDEKCASGDCPAASSDKQACSAEGNCCAEGKCDDKEECCEKECDKEQVALVKCATEKCSAGACSTQKCATGECAKSKCSAEKCSQEICSTEKCGTEKCTAGKSGGEKCAFTTTLGPLRCALEATPVSIEVTVQNCSKSECDAKSCTAEKCTVSTEAGGKCQAGECAGETCPVAACANQVCNALKCAVQSCTTSSDNDCCADAVCATGTCGTSQCAALQCNGQECPAGKFEKICSSEVNNGLKYAVEACLTASGGQITFTTSRAFTGEPVASTCSTDACAEKTCSTEKCGTEKCATSTCSTSPCSTSKCASAKCSTEVCTAGTCSKAKCAAEQCSIETCSDKTCTAGECSTGKCGKTDCATECTAGVGELEMKLAQLEQLQRDIVELRRTTGAPEQMIVKVAVVEINRTECRNKGFDFETTSDTGKGDLVSQIQRFPALIEALERNHLARIVANPTLAVASGRPAKFHAGGKALVTDSNGNTIEKEVGAKVDVLARSIGGNKVRVEIRPEFSEVKEGRPMIETHSVDAAFETTLGTPFVLADSCMTRVKSVTREVDGEQRQREEIEDIQRLTLVTVEGVGASIERPAIRQTAYEKTLVEAVQEPEFLTKVYPVPDLQVWKVRPQGVQFDADLLVAHLKSTVDPQSWRGAVYSSPADAEHANGAIQPFERNGSLVICQTEENHEQIANLLQKMRADGQEEAAAREEHELLDGGVTPASAESPVEQEEKCAKGACSESKCNGSKCQGAKCSKSEVSTTTAPAAECAGNCQGECHGESPETASCPCIGGTCTR